MNQFTRMLSLVATHRLARLEITVQTHSFQNAADGGRRNPDARGNMRAGKTLATPFADPRDDMLWCRPVEAVRPRGTVPQTGDPLGGNAPPICGRCTDRRLRLVRRPAASVRSPPASQSALDRLRQSGILVDVASLQRENVVGHWM
jgi:hypothetical protein